MPGLTWGGDCLVEHLDGRTELIRNVIVKPAQVSRYGFAVAYKPERKRRRRKPSDGNS